MLNIPVIAKREIKAYFLSPAAYMVLTSVALTQGLFFAIYAGGPRVEPDRVLQFVLWVSLYLMVVAAPIIAMRLLSQERADGTVEILMTSPVRVVDVVVGKYVASLLLGVSLMVPLLLQTAFLCAVGDPDPGVIMGGFLGLYLVTAQFLSVGLFCSALTRTQIGSAISGFAVLIALFFVWLTVRDRTSTLARIFRYLAPQMHYGSFVKGLVDTRHVVYFVGTTLLFLVWTMLATRSARWRAIA